MVRIISIVTVCRCVHCCSSSSLTMIKAVNNCVDQVAIPFDEALRMASIYPATVAKVNDQLGKIEKGFKADLVILSKDREVKKVFRDGIAVY